MRILLIENDFSIGRKLKNLLEKNRYTVDVATVPGDALCYGPSSPFHLIIFGVSSTVPDKHSLSTLAELRQNRIATPLLYLCSTDAIEERIQALNTGADDCLPKSFAPRMSVKSWSPMVHISDLGTFIFSAACLYPLGKGFAPSATNSSPSSFAKGITLGG